MIPPKRFFFSKVLGVPNTCKHQWDFGAFFMFETKDGAGSCYFSDDAAELNVRFQFAAGVTIEGAVPAPQSELSGSSHFSQGKIHDTLEFKCFAFPSVCEPMIPWSSSALHSHRCVNALLPSSLTTQCVKYQWPWLKKKGT